MEVLIIEKKNGKVIAHYSVNLNGQNYTPTEDEYYSEAWKCAIEDEIVKSDNHDMYSFSMSEE